MFTFDFHTKRANFSTGIPIGNCGLRAIFTTSEQHLLLSMCFGYRMSVPSFVSLDCGFHHFAMTPIIRLGCFFFGLNLLGRAISPCKNSYLDLCGCNGSEDKGRKFKDHDDDENNICDCQQVKYCSVIELSEKYNTARVLFKADTNVTEPGCVITSLDSKVVTLPYKIIQTENEFLVEIFTESNFGKYKVICDLFETPEKFITSTYTQWDIVSIHPTEVLVDSQVVLQLTVTPQPDLNSTSAWCFLKSPDQNLEVLSSSWVSGTEINCLKFQPTIPGIFSVSLSASFTPNIFDRAVYVTVTSKYPVAEQAVYDSDFKKIFIYFDGNIELHSTCVNVFPKIFLDDFGVDFNCFIKANILVIKMGRQFKIINTIAINAENKICRAGSELSEFCLPAKPVNLTILRPKVSDPNLSFYVDSPCGNSTPKQMSVKVIPLKHTNFPPKNQTKHKTPGSVQRKNLMTWRLMREVQSKFSSQLVFQLNETDVQPLYNTLPSLVQALDVEHLSSAARVFVFVQSSPTTIMAEANVTFCGGSVKLFHHRWVVNGKDVFEDGKLLILKGLTPGKYVIECMVIANNSEVLGQGWTTTEIISSKEKVLVAPLETTAGERDGIFLRTVTWNGNSVSWTCKMENNKVCFTNDRKLVRDVIDLNSPNISIPAGTLPVGVYIWTVENAKGFNTARVVVKTGNSPSVRVESPLIVKPLQDVVLRGVVWRMRDECHAWWTSVRQKGFTYLNVMEVRRDTSRLTTDISLEIHSENTKILEPDSLYLFQLHVFCQSDLNHENGSYEYVKIPLLVNNPPKVSEFTVEPLTGAAMITNFVVSGAAAADSSFDDYPLMYEWSYVDPCDVEVPIKRGGSPMNFTTYLPPGDLKLTVKVCNGKNICSTASTPVISVVQESEFPVHNFHNARKEIQNLLTSGENLEGFGLATTVFKSLALLAETETREGIISTVENAIENRIKILTKRVRSDPRMMDSGLEFFGRAVAVSKYLRNDSPILNRLREFKESILKVNAG